MRLTKLGHACVRLEKDGGVLVIDPGVWAGPDAVAGADAILITHEHPDHLDGDTIRTAMGSDAELQLWTNPAVAAKLADLGPRVHAVQHGDEFAAAGFDVRVYGRDHAQIHRDIPVIANSGFAVDGEVLHPGDALIVPDEPVPTLLFPINAPWLKAAELIDYTRAVAPARGYAIHDGLLNANGLGLMANLLTMTAQPGGAVLARLEPGTSVEL